MARGLQARRKVGLFRINYHEHNLTRNPTNGTQAFKFIIRESLEKINTD